MHKKQFNNKKNWETSSRKTVKIVIIDIKNFNSPLSKHHSFGSFNNIILLKLIKIQKEINGLEFIVLNLNNFLLFWVIWRQFFILPLLSDISISQPYYFVSQLFVSHQSLNSRRPYFNPSVVIFCYSYIVL